ncbi:MAG: nucleoside-diphosphate sugar epimerase [Bacteroidetes bacterium]|nr:MAG: nucleoside-diphosphate sugar epimerase [Bacteroidota bacterium]RLD82198.1 MAG: nucleoside-diphosphate sugar epimerase [Bacteroidota bacterium]
MSKIAVVFGATGLIGRELVSQLIDNEEYHKVLIFNRRSQNYENSKIEELIIGEQYFESISGNVIADELYCCIGTTMKKAGSKAAFQKVDYEIPVWLAKTAEKNGINKLLIVSSVGANPKSKNFYLSTKGKMEQEVLKYNIPEIYFFRPSMLLGQRDESRFSEMMGQKAMKLTGFLMKGPLKKYKAIPAPVVAQAMQKVAKKDYSRHFFESDELWKIAKS